ncbi:MAG: polyprenyl synthetase family protein [Candidatus Thermoplasmatota archaeon]|nr:polyprenyl synthetase family protein [Candidatus Thermoplasmatota archaeon]
MGSWDLSISKELSLVEDLIQRSIDSRESLLTEIAGYVIGAGGKRVRPAVTILSYYVVGGKDVDRAVQIAAALELVHSATLLHDDINDGGVMRRGQPAAFKKYGLQNALVTGDFLFTKAFAIGARFDPEIVEVTAEACVRLAEGEVRQQGNARDLSMSEEDYLAIIQQKTAGLFAAGARIGAMLGGGNPQQIAALSEYGRHLGIAFQIVDDILDVVGDESVTGKPIGSDVREGNVTLLLQHALNNGNPTARTELEGIIREGPKSEEEVLRAIDIIAASGAVDEARARASEYAVRARESLDFLGPEPQKLELMRIADLVLHRDA